MTVGRPLLSVIVLTKDKETNLPELLASLDGLDAEVFVVDSGSRDHTVEIAEQAGSRVVFHPFENYAAQRNWAIEHLPIRTPWQLHLDADERLTPALVREIRDLLASNPPHDGYLLRKRTVFMGRWLRFGGQYPSWHLRLFRTGKGRCEQRLYDQHFVVDGRVGRLRHDYIDVITDDLGKWIERHNRWALAEAIEMERAVESLDVAPRLFGSPIERKRWLRIRMYRSFPPFVRPFLLFMFDYVFRLGFLDGIPGLIFYILQRFWFRFLIDARIYERRLMNGRRTGTAALSGKREPSP